MSKRFIDTNLFNDEWFCSLSKDAKLFFIYFITSCNHAGMLKLNKKLCEFQTKLKSIDTLTKELGNSLVTLNGSLWMPRYIKYQYPGFPKSAVRQQEGALKILLGNGLTIEEINSYLTLTKELPNSYVSETVIVIEKKRDIKGKTSFENSKWFDKAIFFNDCPKDWSEETKENWYLQALSYSKANGGKYIDWIAAIVNWNRKKPFKNNNNLPGKKMCS